MTDWLELARGAAPVRRLGVFGGTFDPIHVAHLAIAEAARTQAELDVVLFVPARQNPLKGGASETAPEDRCEMVRLALADAPGFALSRVEIERRDPSFTVDTLRALRDLASELFLIVGADAYADLARWQRAAEVLELAAVLVARRPGSPPPERGLALAIRGSARVIGIETPLIDLSSSELRALGRSGRSLRYLVPEAAWRYAAARGLYGQGRLEGD